ncbi:MAG: HAD family hydrolase [Firmicutes bacterium]|nr:HAD family hydrolase [Bacillota bacterium]
MIRLVAVDLDGTLLNPAAQPHPKAMGYLRSLARAGTAVVLASGRSWRTVLEIQQRLGIVGPFIAHNGAYVHDTGTRLDLWTRTVPPEVTRRMFAWADAENLMLRAYLPIPHPVVFNRFTVEHLHRWYRPGDVVRADAAAHLERGALEIFLLGDGEVDRMLNAFGPRGNGYELVVLPRGPLREVEVCAPGVDKLDGVRAVAAFYEVPASQVLAIGDGLNDVGVLRWAGLSVAVGRGVPEARAAADLVSPVEVEDPVSWALETAVAEGIRFAPARAAAGRAAELGRAGAV